MQGPHGMNMQHHMGNQHPPMQQGMHHQQMGHQQHMGNQHPPMQQGMHGPHH